MDPPSHSAFPFAPTPRDESRLWLQWLVRLRWVAIVAQTLTVGVTTRVLDGPGVIFTLLLILGALVAVNLQALHRLAAPQPPGEMTLFVQLAVDVVALTAFFFLAGGPANPFSTLYVVHIAMAAVMLRPRSAMGLTGLALACYGALHLGSLPLHIDRFGVSTELVSLSGRAVSFTITTISVSSFVIGLASALRLRSKMLLTTQERTAQTDRLRAVGTLAAGAAHELNTPLSTIGLRLRRLGRRHTDADTVDDLTVTREQLERCSTIVERLLTGAGDPTATGIEQRDLRELVGETIDWWNKGSEVEATLVSPPKGLVVEVPRVAFSQALVNLLENGREAQAAVDRADPIEVEIRAEDGRGVVVIRDHGCGLPEEPERVGDPFFTTKPTGTGLGVYVARAVATGAGGGLRYVAGDGHATEAHWWFPTVGRRTA